MFLRILEATHGGTKSHFSLVFLGIRLGNVAKTLGFSHFDTNMFDFTRCFGGVPPQNRRKLDGLRPPKKPHPLFYEVKKTRVE